MIWTFLIPLLGIVPMFIIFGLLTWQNRRLDADERREAITTQLRNLPAASLQKRRDDLVERQVSRLVASAIIGLSAAMFVVSRRRATGLSNWNWIDTAAVVLIVGCGLYYGLLVMREMPQGRKLRQAIRAEQATAQELSASLAGDNRVIHDVMADGFNIDHVVVTLAGVFAIETKSRLKPPAGNGSPKVKYNGKALDFGTWTETKPVEQAERQARWLANYLQKETGESAPVTAVLALPGWFVERTAPIAPSRVQVINPKNSRWLFLPSGKEPLLDAAMIQRAANAIEKLARVAPA